MRFESIVSIVMVLVAVGAVWWFRPETTAPGAQSIETLVTSSTATSIVVVHVSGAVARPGLVRVERDARIADAIQLAGGTTVAADLRAINLAALVVDGQQIVVPEFGAEPPTGGTADGRIRVNSATVPELEQLPGVGPVLARRILEHREEVGGFEEVEDLLDVPGIGEATLADIRDHVLVP